MKIPPRYLEAIKIVYTRLGYSIPVNIDHMSVSEIGADFGLRGGTPQDYEYMGSYTSYFLEGVLEDSWVDTKEMISDPEYYVDEETGEEMQQSEKALMLSMNFVGGVASLVRLMGVKNARHYIKDMAEALLALEEDPEPVEAITHH